MQIIRRNITIAAGETWELTDDVQLAYGATITVEAGGRVVGNGHQLEVFGAFKARGNLSNSVSIDDLHLAVGANSGDRLALIDVEFSELNGGTFLSPTGNAIYYDVRLVNSVLRG